MMTYSVELHFDSESEDKIRKLWNDINKVTPNFMIKHNVIPHVSLGVWEDIGADKLIPMVEKFSDDESALLLFFYGLGIFPTDESTLYLAPFPSAALLNFHKRFHQKIGELSSSCLSYYRPSSWIPHCTLNTHFDINETAKMIDSIIKQELRFGAFIGSIVVIDVDSRKILYKKDFQS